jgi:hypothetical protein
MLTHEEYELALMKIADRFSKTPKLENSEGRCDAEFDKIIEDVVEYEDEHYPL